MSVSATDRLDVASTEAVAPSRDFTSSLLLAVIVATELVWLGFLLYLALELVMPAG